MSSSLSSVARFHRRVALLSAVLLSGCLSLQPVDRLTPSVGAEVAVDLNDAGRAALAPKLGPQIAQVHGHLLRRDGDEDLLAVTSAEFLRGGSQIWGGDTVRVSADYTTRYYENRVSTKRSLIFGGLVAGALAIMTTEALRSSPAVHPGDSGLEQPGDKLRLLPRRGLHLSTSILMPFLSRH